MTYLIAADELSALRRLVFGTVDDWNAAHPHRLRSHRERASISVVETYTDASGAPSYSLTVECTLGGAVGLTFHGSDLAAVAEHARLTLEHKIEVELRRRADYALEHDSAALHRIAV